MESQARIHCYRDPQAEQSSDHAPFDEIASALRSSQ
jgi:hypothetical protein